MLKKRRILLVLLFLIGVAPVAFFARYEYFSDHLEQELGFDSSEANAAKHAYAAGQVYTLLRTVMDADMAEDATLRLGVLTEYMETIVKISEPDATSEIMKDMYNNQAGIMAAEWAMADEKRSLRDTILALTRSRGIAVSRFAAPMKADANTIEDYPQSVRHASFWFCEQQKTIKHTIGKALEK